MTRRRVRSLVALAATAVVLAACTGTSEPTDGAGTGLPIPTDSEPALPVPPDTDPSDLTTTIPEGALFGGNLCGALTAADIAATPVDGRSGARLVSADAASIDSCAYDVAVGSRHYDVIVKAVSESDFAAPGGTSFEVSPISGIGDRALGVDFGDVYAVFVKVENGYFSVSTPDADSAEELARRAAPRATQPAAPVTTEPEGNVTPATDPPVSTRPSTTPGTVGPTTTVLPVGTVPPTTVAPATTT